MIWRALDLVGVAFTDLGAEGGGARVGVVDREGEPRRGPWSWSTTIRSGELDRSVDREIGGLVDERFGVSRERVCGCSSSLTYSSFSSSSASSASACLAIGVAGLALVLILTGLAGALVVEDLAFDVAPLGLEDEAWWAAMC